MKSNNDLPPFMFADQFTQDHVRTIEEEAARRKRFDEPYVNQTLRAVEGAPQYTQSFLDGDFYIQDAGVEVLGEI